MKLNKFVLPIFLLGLVACSEDEIGNSDKWKVEGVVPANFVGCINKAVSSRSTIEGIWEAGNAIGISGGDKYVNCKYVAETEGTDRHFTPATKEDSIYFDTAEPISFTAYYPYTGNTGTVAGVITKKISGEDQTKENITNIDYLFGDGKGSKASPLVALELKHKMSLVVFNFENGYGVDLDQMENFTISGLKLEGTFDPATGNAVATSTATEDITIAADEYSGTTSYTKSVILFPQTDLNLNMSANFGSYEVNGSFNISKLESGKKYTFNVYVNKGGLDIELNGSVAWEDDVQNSDATEVVTKVTIPALPSVEGVSDVKLTVGTNEYTSSNWPSNSINVASGEEVVFSFKLAEGKRVTAFDGSPKSGSCKMQFSYQDGVSKCTYSDFGPIVELNNFGLTVGEESRTGAAPKVGDYFYSDGSWGTEKTPSGKNIIGVIFNVGVGAGPGNFWGMNKYSGYVMALTNIDGVVDEWAYDKDPVELKDARCSFGEGYDVNILSKGTENCVGYFTYLNIKDDQSFATKYLACSKAIDFKTKVSTPTNTSGWYLPSLGEFALFYKVKNNVETAFDNINDKALKVNRWFGFYWTLSLSSDNKPVFFEPFKSSLDDAIRTNIDPKADPLVRPILTF